MATKIVTKNSSTASAVPTAAQLVQGELAVNVADKRLYTENNAGAVVELGTNPSTLTVTGEITANGGIAFGDNAKATFGAGDDLQIYHDGFNTNIKESGAGSLLIDAANTYFRNAAGTKDYAWMVDGGAVSLFYDNANKLATTSTGIDVTGTATMDGLVVGDGHTIGDDLFDNLLIEAASGEGIRLVDNHATNPLTVDSNVGFRVQTILGTDRFFVDNSNGDISFYEDTGTTAKLFWDASAESLGIGTSSPAGKLDVLAGSDQRLLFTTLGTDPFIGAVNADNSAYKMLQLNGSEMRLMTNGTERMRIDSSGNLLVGKTSASSATVGFQAGQDGFTAITRASGQPLVLNRTTNDGIIADFRKDGTTVGSIGTNSGYVRIGTDDTNLLMHSVIDTIVPHSGSANRDAAISLGYSGARFKDLYLSGGVYLGGTGAANLLDDYEEGTWTPTLTRSGASTNATITLDGAARYTKVGSLVTLNFYISAISNFPTDGTSAIIQGIPFPTNQWGAGSIAYGTATTCSYTNWAVGANIGYFMNNNNDGFRNGTIDLNRGMFTVSYQTNS